MALRLAQPWEPTPSDKPAALAEQRPAGVQLPAHRTAGNDASSQAHSSTHVKANSHQAGIRCCKLPGLLVADVHQLECDLSSEAHRRGQQRRQFFLEHLVLCSARLPHPLIMHDNLAAVHSCTLAVGLRLRLRQAVCVLLRRRVCRAIGWHWRQIVCSLTQVATVKRWLHCVTDPWGGAIA